MSEFTDILEKWKENVLQLDAKSPLISFKPPRGAVEIDTDNPYQVFEDLIVKKTNQIPGMQSQMPEGAFYTMPNITGTKLSSKEMETLLLEELKVATVAGTSFGKFGEGYIRFSYANSQENIIEALNRIHEYAIENKWG